MSLLVGLTGGIGSGKSTVARLLADRGASIIDADQLAREAVAPKTPALAEIVKVFGSEVLSSDGTLDRAKLGAIVFSDEQARAKLNAIVHPEVSRISAERIALGLASGVPLVIYDVPLLFENHLQATFPVVVVVSAPEEVQIARVMARDALSAEAARARLAAQMPLSEKAKRADFVVDNGGTLVDTERQVDELVAALLAKRTELEGGP